ncbi:hypothetical protein PILCRDRAFT_328976 [Piloderma croceum F 1598]|uniref:Uncharacterized protein n=1 Tax=Piloderma croceum (strain F 1598) TaxID=765440 RepID=A0A0C3FPC7_PILCF|nr:hypothetical protein PILCRDRAFT_328976 [Piloderma croceum F 1598]
METVEVVLFYCADNILSVILTRPAVTTIAPSSSNTSNLSAGPPSWLVEIHQKLWSRQDLFDQIFCTANLTKPTSSNFKLNFIDSIRPAPMNPMSRQMFSLSSRTSCALGALTPQLISPSTMQPPIANWCPNWMSISPMTSYP